MWRHHRGPVEPPMRLSQLGYDADRIHATTTPRRSRPRDYITDSRNLPCTFHETTPTPEGHVNTDFDHLRWFDLPSQCLELTDRNIGPASYWTPVPAVNSLSVWSSALHTVPSRA